MVPGPGQGTANPDSKGTQPTKDEGPSWIAHSKLINSWEQGLSVRSSRQKSHLCSLAYERLCPPRCGQPCRAGSSLTAWLMLWHQCCPFPLAFVLRTGPEKGTRVLPGPLREQSGKDRQEALAEWCAQLAFLGRSRFQAFPGPCAWSSQQVSL